MTLNLILAILSFLSSITFCSYAHSEGILNNPCFGVDKNGNLQRLDSLLSCKGNVKSFNNLSATGSTDLGRGYAIQIKKTDATGFNVFEANEISATGTSFVDFPELVQTHVDRGVVVDQTFCSRSMAKAFPVVKSDDLTCITLDRSLCTQVRSFMNQNPFFRDKVSDEEIKKCESVMARATEAVHKALADRWKIPSYNKLAKSNFESIKNFSDEKMPSEMKKNFSKNLNMSEVNPKSGAVQIGGIFQGYRLASELLTRCIQSFPSLDSKSDSGLKSRSPKNTSDKNASEVSNY